MQKKGFTLLVSLLLSGILVAISISIFNITLKHLALSTSSRESLYAYYASYAGYECALYWDLKPACGSMFATSTAEGTCPLPRQITCSGKTIPPGSPTDPPSIIGNTEGDQFTPTGQFRLNFLPQGCADILIYKYSDLVTGKLKTKIESRGYNNCDATDPRRVERGIEAEF